MKRTAVAMLCMAIYLISCEKLELSSPESSSAATKANKQEITITTQPPSNHFFIPTVEFFSNGEFFDDGDVISDNCDYMNLKPSSGKVKVQSHGLGAYDYLMTINEQRSGATATAVGEPYYWISYGVDEPAFRYSATDLASLVTYFPYEKIGPFTDSTISGTGSWNISQSSHPLIKSGNGTLTYGTSITYGYGGYLDGSLTITLSDISKLIRSTSTLTGTYK